MATSTRPNFRRASTETTIPTIRFPRQYDDSDKDAIPKINYPIIIIGSIGVAFLLFWHRERTKNTFTSTPILTVQPSTNADVSTLQNIQHVLEYDVSVLDARATSQQLTN